jgi:hypothetical protein
LKDFFGSSTRLKSNGSNEMADTKLQPGIEARQSFLRPGQMHVTKPNSNRRTARIGEDSYFSVIANASCQITMTDDSECSCDMQSVCVRSGLSWSSFAMYDYTESPLDDFTDSTTYLAESDGSLDGSISGIDWSAEWGEADSVYSSVRIQEIPIKKAVRFGCVRVREFALTIGETPALDEYQCPLTLSWTHSPIEQLVLLSPLGRRSPVPRRSSPKRLSLRERQTLLMESNRHVAFWRRLQCPSMVSLAH